MSDEIVKICKRHGPLKDSQIRLHRKQTETKAAYYRCIQCYENDLKKQRKNPEKRAYFKSLYTRSVKNKSLEYFRPAADHFCRTDADLTLNEIDEIFVNLKIDNLGYV